MSTITAEIDEQTFTVDLSRVHAVDAMSFRQATSEVLDVRVALLTQADTFTIEDLAVIKWLYVRQNVDPRAAFTDVAVTVTLFPPAAVEAAGLDAPGAG